MKLGEKIKSAIALRGLILRAAIFGAVWFFLPKWVFLLVGIYFYFFPFFRPLKLAIPFLLTIFFAVIEPQSIWQAAFFSVLFYLILGIKDLIFINRRSAYEVLVLLLLFLVFVSFFSHIDNWNRSPVFFYAFALGAAFFFLIRGFITYSETTELKEGPAIWRRELALGIAALLVWQISLALLFLPLNFLYQSALSFLVATIFVEVISDYLSGSLSRKKLLANFSVFFILVVVILGLAEWGL